MKITPIGVGDAFSQKWYSSSVVVEHNGHRLLIDCPHPIRKILLESAELDVKDIDAIVLTHLHADHASGLEGFSFFSRIVLNQRVVVISHEDVLKDLWGHHYASMGQLLPGPIGANLTPGNYQLNDLPNAHRHNHHDKPAEGFYFASISVPDSGQIKTTECAGGNDIQIIRNQQGILKFGEFTLECRRTIHHIPTFAWKIYAGDKVLAYSADTCFDPYLIDWLNEDSDMIIHETNYGPHTPYKMLCGLSPDIKKKMRLIHYPDDFDLADSEIEPLEQGLTYEVG